MSRIQGHETDYLNLVKVYRKKDNSQLDLSARLLQEMSSNLGVLCSWKYYQDNWVLEGFLLGVHEAQEGGTFGIPCRWSSTITLSVAGGFRPRGSGSHGFVKTSPIAASTLSFVCNSKQQTKQIFIKTCNLEHVIHETQKSKKFSNAIYLNIN